MTTRHLVLSLAFCGAVFLVAIYFLGKGIAEGLLDWLR